MALQGESPEHINRVLSLIIKFDIDPDEEFFLIIAAIGHLKVLVEDAPKEWQHLFELFSGELDQWAATNVEHLRLFAQPVRIGVGEGLRPVGPVDHAPLPTGIARQPRVPDRMSVARHDGVARREARRGRRRRLGRRLYCRRRARCAAHARQLGVVMLAEERDPRLQFIAVNEPLLDRVAHHRRQPTLVVRRPQVFRRGHAFDAMAERVDVVVSRTTQEPIEAKHAAFPCGVEDRLILLALDRAEAVHAAEVVDAVHGALPSPPLRSPRAPCAKAMPAGRHK